MNITLNQNQLTEVMNQSQAFRGYVAAAMSGANVSVKNNNGQTYKFPKGEFTQAQFASANGMPKRGTVWFKLDELVQNGVLNKTIRNGKGHPKAFFTVR